VQVILGALIAVTAGIINGLFALPMKLARKWSWENVWLPFSALALVVFPYLVASRGTPRLWAAFQQAEPSSLLIAVLCGIAVYSGSLMFGISLNLIGNALAFSLLVGSMSAVGVLSPILVFHPEVLATPGGKWIILGISFLFAALIVCAWAGVLKARAQADSSPQKSRGGSSGVFRGMSLAIAGGVLSGFLPLGMSMGWAKGIAEAAVQFGGAGQAAAQNTVLLPILIGGALPNCLYAARLLFRNKTYEQYRGPRWYWLIILLMAIMYSGSVALWGMSSAGGMLGGLGPSVGWALFVGGLVVSSNVGGLATGEWKNAGGKPLGWMVGGVTLMVAAVSLIGYGNFVLNSQS
jgi:L-rhamnose-H+ transport protein